MAERVAVYGLTDDEQQALRELAQARYGKPSISLLAKNLLKEQISKPIDLPLVHLPKPKSRKRITIRLPELDRAFLEETAAQQNCTINDLVRDIVQSHVRQHPFHSPEELNALYQSNFQLVALGRNINQIARQLNAGEPVSLSTQFLADIKQMIDKHTEKVGQILLTNRKRLPRKGE